MSIRCNCYNEFVFNNFIKIGGKQMSIKKEPAIAEPSQYNYITKVAKRLRNAKTSVLDMLSHPVISDVNIKGGEFEFMIEDFEAFYEESEGCHIYIEHHDSDSKEFPYKAFFRLYNNRFAILLTHKVVIKRSEELRVRI